MSDQLMDTEAGGESTQYESIKTVTEPNAKDESSFADAENSTEATRAQADEHAAKGERKAENVRYGQAISEGGMGGETTTNEGAAGQGGGFGGTKAEVGEERDETGAAQGQERGVMGYGEGSGVGA
ncbi:MAG: hypothetical protein M1833_006659 [Piccolia ochrophora]|nr:MAG: hypothetical protein M1833_006659 [Piccolia ochrophora]